MLKNMPILYKATSTIGFILVMSLIAHFTGNYASNYQLSNLTTPFLLVFGTFFGILLTISITKELRYLRHKKDF
jgi:hypothetical protein